MLLLGFFDLNCMLNLHNLSLLFLKLTVNVALLLTPWSPKIKIRPFSRTALEMNCVPPFTALYNSCPNKT